LNTRCPWHLQQELPQRHATHSLGVTLLCYLASDNLPMQRVSSLSCCVYICLSTTFPLCSSLDQKNLLRFLYSLFFIFILFLFPLYYFVLWVSRYHKGNRMW
jgi:RsiW-degrading membrane proteinase PrsW (M82 family)